MPALMVAAIGVVFGDIGTSPLYALKECFDPQHGIPFNQQAVFGIISLLFWALVIVVSLKYVLFVMRADNRGEGGVLALMALSLRSVRAGSKWASVLMMLGMFGACMFYGDAVITPAISVMSAVEGLEIAAPSLTRFVLPITIVILIILFSMQKSGTAKVGRLFGPVMVVWFVILGVLGVYNMFAAPEIIKAINPYYGIHFIHTHALQAYIVLGSVFLVLTGAEALYADMGHFGIRPIRFAWTALVFPALVLNYFGQGALLLSNPKAIENPFFLMAPDWALLPLVVVATAATVIASQAVISGAFSLTSQAIQLGYVPRMKILHTSDREIGQIYMPVINWSLLLVIIWIVLAFKSSSNLAAAYGIAVTTTMVITTILACVVMVKVWNWNKFLVALIITGFLVVDFAFFGANLIKVEEGGWLPLALGAFLFFMLMTWHKGRQLLRERTAADGIPLGPFLQGLLAHPPHRVAGTAIYLTGQHAGAGELAAQPQAQPHPARAHHLPDVPHGRRALCRRRQAHGSEGPHGRLVQRSVDLRFQRNAGREGSAASARRKDGHAFRTDGYVVLPGPRNRGADQAAGDVDLARTPVRVDASERSQADRLLQHPG